jgi:hypothetical protein
MSKTVKQSLVWGGVLIIVGILSLVNLYTELSPWVWAAFLALAGLGALGLYLTDRSDWSMLLATYVLWAITLLVVLVTQDVLRDEAVVFYVLPVIAVPFLVVFWRDRAQWWALIPAYVLLAVALMIGLEEAGILDELLVPAYVLFVIAIPFFVVYARNRKLWWALIPGGILAVIGLSFLIAEAAFGFLGAIVLIAVGGWFLWRAFTRREPSAVAGQPVPDEPAPASPEDEEPTAE